MCMNDVVADVASRKSRLNDTAGMDSAPFCWVFFNGKYATSHFQQITNIASFIQTRNSNVSNWRNGQTAANSVQPRQQIQYRQCLTCRGGWSNYNWNPFSNRNILLSIGTNKIPSRGGTSYAGCSGPPSNNRSYKNSS